MHRNNTLILLGAPFKVALRVILLFVVITVFIYYTLFAITDNAFETEIHNTKIQDIRILTNIYNKEGLPALQRTLSRLQSSERFFILIDKNGELLTKTPLDKDFKPLTAPSFSLITVGNQRYYATLSKLNDLTLAIVFNANFLNGIKTKLSRGILSSSAIFIIITLLLGYFLSRHTSKKLQQFEMTLTDIADGDLSARLPVNSPKEQIDIIAEQINIQLTHLQSSINRIKNNALGIAHDLKTPLSRSRLSLYSALEAIEKQEDPTSFIQQSLQENLHLGDIFDTLLRISRIQSKKIDKNLFTYFELLPIISNIVNFLSLKAEDNLQSIQVYCDNSISAYGDKNMLQQAIINLIDNAIVHAGNGCAITIEAKILNEYLYLTVRDTGVGVPDHEINNILAPFARTDSKNLKEGNGLGLALVDAITVYHGGNILLNHIVPHGLSITLMLPIKA